MGKHVLIAEDSSVIQNLARKILEQQDFDIVAVKNGSQVIEQLQKQHFNIILMDINMPVMDGMECTRKIRSMQDAAIAEIPIVAITGNARNYSSTEFEEAGVTHVLQKPLNFDELVKVTIKYTS